MGAFLSSLSSSSSSSSSTPKEDKEVDFVLDVQGFKCMKNTFIIKELAMIEAFGNDTRPSTYLFKPPYEWENLDAKHQKENQWISHNHTGIMWTDGDEDYENVDRVLNEAVKGARRIYVKGLEKKSWIEQHLWDLTTVVVNVEDYGCPALPHMRRGEPLLLLCRHHWPTLGKTSICAADNVELIRRWILEFCPIKL